MEKEKLIDWLYAIALRITYIKKSFDMYDIFKLDVRNGKFKNLSPEYLWWIKTNYECTIIMLITGLLEKSKKHKKDALCFPQFLKAVNEYGVNKLKKELCTQPIEYLTSFDNPILMKSNADDLLEDNRKEYLENNVFDKVNINNDTTELNNLFVELNEYRNKHIGHFTSNNASFNITTSDLDRIINNIIQIFDKYSYLVNSTYFIF